MLRRSQNPAEFAPYGIQTVTDAQGVQTIWVTYTALDKAQKRFCSHVHSGRALISEFALMERFIRPGRRFGSGAFGR